MTATINNKVVIFLVDTGSVLTILHRDTWEKCKEPQQQLVPWCQSKLVGAEGSQLRVFGSAVVKLNIEGENLELSVVVIDPLTSEAILGLDVLTQCTVDLLHKRLITGAGHVVNMYCQGQGQQKQWNTDPTDVCEKHEIVNTMISTSMDQPLLGKVVDENLLQEGSIEVSHAADISDTMDNSQMGEPSYVLTVKLIDNIRVPAFSELEVLAQVKCDGSRCYVLENNLKTSDLLVARACYTW